MRHTAILVLLLLSTLARSTCYSVATLPFGGPDEKAHFEYVASMGQTRGREIRGGERHQPPLYYLLAQPFYAAAERQPTAIQLVVVRQLSIWLGVLHVLLAFLAARRLFGNEPLLSLGPPVVLAFLPAHTALAAAIPNDMVATVVGAGLALLTISPRHGGPAKWTLPLLLGLALPAALAKFTVYPILAASAAAIAWAHWRRPALRPWLLAALLALVLTAALALLFAAPLVAQAAQLPRLQRLVTEELTAERMQGFLRAPFRGYAVQMLRSFVTIYPVDSLWLPWPVYAAVAAGCAWALWGLVRLWRGAGIGAPDHSCVPGCRAALWYCAAAVLLQGLLALAGFYHSQSVLAAQGRYFFPVLVPLSLLFCAGLYGAAPGYAQRTLLWLAASLALLDLGSQAYGFVVTYLWERPV